MSLTSPLKVLSSCTTFAHPSSTGDKYYFSVTSQLRGRQASALARRALSGSISTSNAGQQVPFGSPFLDGASGAGVKDFLRKRRSRGRHVGLEARASGIGNLLETATRIMEAVKWGWTASPPTWEAAAISVGSIFVVGAPLLFVGLTTPGMVSAYALGTVIWRAYGGQGLLTIMIFYLLGTAATKLKLKEKQKEGIAEKRSGRRGPASVWASGTAAAICSLCSIYGVGGQEIAPLWHLGYLASLCTKLSDSISSEIGKAYGKTTYLVTTFSTVPRGTEGAVSLEGTLAGAIASIILAAASYSLEQVDLSGAIIAVVASQLANLFESYLGATIQGRPSFEWLSNDIVNVVNVTSGAAIAILSKKCLG